MFLIDYAARLLRPVSLVKRVGNDGLAVIKSVYPEKLVGAPGRAIPLQDAGPVERTILHRGTSGVILAVNVPQLVAKAEKANGVIEFAPQVGDFVGADEPLFLLHGGAKAVDEKSLRDCVIFGSERTLEQDPLFAFRILVDIAIKALSAAINDPTTGEQLLDRVEDLLTDLVQRDLHTGVFRDDNNIPRLVYPTPTWEDYLRLGVTEIRLYGGLNPQICRRMAALLENLLEVAPPYRRALILEEQERLRRNVEQNFPDPLDRAVASVSDTQGLGATDLPAYPSSGAQSV